MVELIEQDDASESEDCKRRNSSARCSEDHARASAPHAHCATPEGTEPETSSTRGTGTGTGRTVEEMIAQEKQELHDKQADSMRASNFGLFAQPPSAEGAAEGAAGEGAAGTDVEARLRASPLFDSEHLADPAFVAKVREVHAHPELLGASLADPRLMQAMMALQGLALDVSEADLARAEKEGAIQERPVVPERQRQVAQQCQDAASAKECGNRLFKEQQLTAALACYERALELAARGSEAALGAEFECSVLGNTALVLLKLGKPAQAEQACCRALAAAPPSCSLTKVYYRRAVAREQQGATAGAAEDMAAAVGAAQEAAEAEARCVAAAPTGLARRMPHAAPAVRSLHAEATRLHKELSRLQGKVAAQEAAEAARAAEAEEQRKLEALRNSGQLLDSAPSSCTIATAPAQHPCAGEGEGGAKQGPYGPGVVRETDWSFWATQRMREVAVGGERGGVQHRAGDGSRLQVTELRPSHSEVHASVKSKGGQRALFYDLDMLFDFEASSPPPSHPGADPVRTIHGALRMYNISQETKYCPGGAEGSSWMYSLGFDQRDKGEWVERMKEEANELFHLIAEKIALVLADLRAK